MLSIGPWPTIMSFKPLYAQIELACAGAPVRTPDPEFGTPGVPGGPVTSPAKAVPAVVPVMARAHAVAARRCFARISYTPFLERYSSVHRRYAERTR